MILEKRGDKLAEIENLAWNPGELYVEKLLIPEVGQEFMEGMFNERLVFLGRQLRVAKGRLDLLAIDTQGRGVIIELKKDYGYLGVETQALHYLSALTELKGKEFISQIEKWNGGKKVTEAIEQFVEVDLRQLNTESRIILVAREFDPALFSMGRWLSSKGVAFRCVSYTPLLIEQKKLISFSVIFNSSPYDEYESLLFKREDNHRKPGIFWHNIGFNDQAWWDYLTSEAVLTCSYSNIDSEMCPGYRKLNKYVQGDKIIAYAAGYGAVGCGKIETFHYEYKNHELPEYDGYHYHRIKVQWLVALSLSEAIPVQQVHDQYNLNHPSGTRQQILKNTEDAEKMIQKMMELAKSRAA